jgi:hypothetical protein
MNGNNQLQPGNPVLKGGPAGFDFPESIGEGRDTTL